MTKLKLKNNEGNTFTADVEGNEYRKFEAKNPELRSQLEELPPHWQVYGHQIVDKDKTVSVDLGIYIGENVKAGTYKVGEGGADVRAIYAITEGSFPKNYIAVEGVATLDVVPSSDSQLKQLEGKISFTGQLLKTDGTKDINDQVKITNGRFKVSAIVQP